MPWSVVTTRGFWPSREHRLREDRGRRVRHRVVDVEDVEAVVAAHLGHLDREGQRVVGVLEEAVVVDHDRVEEEPGRVRRQPERPLVADEVRLVAPAGELLAERGGEDAAAADRGIAGDADLEGPAGLHGQKRRAARVSGASESKMSGSLVIEGLRVLDARPQAQDPRAGELQLHVVAGGQLRWRAPPWRPSRRRSPSARRCP